MSEVFTGREPDPTLDAVRAFRSYPGFDVRFASLEELRPAMVQNDIQIIDALANRRRRGAAAAAEASEAESEIAWSDSVLAINAVLEISDARYPDAHGLKGLLSQVYPEISAEYPLVQLYDYPIVDGIASRLNKALQATVFKRDRAEGLAPQTQIANQERAVSMAQERHPSDPGLSEQVGDIYAILVPATVAVQQEMFDRTYLLDDWDGVGF